MPDRPEGHLLHVISHTHWDREWYLTFQQFRVRLVHLIDHLLDLLDRDPEFRHFHLDGQTIVLEDYLAIRPQNEARLRQYIREGRILVGPWYLLNDEFLTSGEATVHNLLYGHGMAADFGAVMKVGYVPDQFGNIGQMPQILQGFGIDNAIFGRGYSLVEPGRKMELLWRAPDGSEVLTHHMAFWYNNAQRFPADPEAARAYTQAIIERTVPVVTTRHLLLMNGVDHLEAQPDLSGILAGLHGRLGGAEICHSTLPAFIAALRAEKPRLAVWEGEFREDRHCQILAGTLSTRMYLKQANERTQTCLEQWAERWNALDWWLGGPHEGDLLQYAWKLLLQNHPHDSICGCSVDAVHEDMMPRFRQAQEVGEEITARSLQHLADQVDTSGAPQGAAAAVLFNPLVADRREVVVADVELPLEGAPPYIRVTDGSGEELPLQMIEVRDTHERRLDAHELPQGYRARRLRFAFEADVPGCGWSTYFVVPATTPPPAAPRLPRLVPDDGDDPDLDNDLPGAPTELAALEEALADLADAAQQAADPGAAVLFEDVGDIGDEYRHIKPARDRRVVGAMVHATIAHEEHGPLLEVELFDGILRVPEAATPDGRARGERTVDLPVTVRVTRRRGCPRLDFEVLVDNRARDHRLRVLVPTLIDTDSAIAEGQFDVIERPLQPPVEWIGASPFQPQQSFVAVQNGDSGMAVVNQGLPEYEVYPDQTTIALTLLRCVERLSTGGEAAAAEAEYNHTPGAQCLGRHTFRYAVLQYEGDWSEAGVVDEAHRHNVPIRVVQTGIHGGPLRLRSSVVQVHGDGVVLSCVKRAEREDVLIVRLWNPTLQTSSVTVNVANARTARLVNLNEEPLAELKVKKDAVRLGIPPKKIVTVALGK